MSANYVEDLGRRNAAGESKALLASTLLSFVKLARI
jgi:hypothetical protein